MSKLISGKEALIALANGEEVEYKTTDNAGSKWHQAKMLTVNTIMNFDDACILLRLKPRTITINGIEVPNNIKKHDKDDVVWVINTSCENWYDWIYGSDCDSSTLYWETEQEVKQVIEALRSIFK